MGGQFQLESKKGQGTQYILDFICHTLPRSDSKFLERVLEFNGSAVINTDRYDIIRLKSGSDRFETCMDKK